ncbi:hypothetical protein VTP01DRAFT_2826 [Rhizomucor pusillus]|uniref:uncharacterized protein n=1 Tax=Rhizomucor pusillus TaxID=4840 RepID=UPI00374263B2
MAGRHDLFLLLPIYINIYVQYPKIHICLTTFLHTTTTTTTSTISRTLPDVIARVQDATFWTCFCST